MSIELQKLDCNCNDCAHLVRSFELRQEHEDFHYIQQKKFFDTKRIKLLKAADRYLMDANKGLRSNEEAKEKSKQLIKEVKNMKFEFDKSKCTLSYGYCSKFGYEKLSFIPNTLQLDTQDCFKHRKD